RSRLTPAVEPSTFLTGSTALRMREGRMTTNYALSWDIARGYVVSQAINTAYMAQCCGVQVEFQKYNYAPNTSVTAFGLPSDLRFNISLVLAGLGSISNFFGAFGGTTTVR